MKQFELVVIGGGPAGTGVLLNAFKQGMLPDLLSAGIALVEQESAMGGGSIGRYRINSDTAANVFLEALSYGDGSLANSVPPELINDFIEAGSSGIALSKVGKLLGCFGEFIRAKLTEAPASDIFTESTAISVQKLSDKFITTIRKGGKFYRLHSQNVVFAMGGVQSPDHSLSQQVKDLSLSQFSDKIFSSDGVLSAQDELDLRPVIASGAPISILGGSHSAFSVASTILNHPFYKGSKVHLFHRAKPKLYYPSVVEAICDGYTDYDELDVCPKTGKVHRLGGLRLESRELLREALGLAPQSHAALEISDLRMMSTETLQDQLQHSAAIITCFGYKPRVIPVFDKAGAEIRLAPSIGLPLVNSDCEVCDYAGQTVEGLYGIGLASGFIPSGAMGGEPSFKGQTNGLWLYQNDVGAKIVDRILQSMRLKQAS
jgi:hypothetical protein